MSEDSTNGVSWSVVASRSTKSNSQKKKSFAGPLQSELVQSSVLGADQKENLILVLDTGAIIKGLTLIGDSIELYTTQDVIDEVKDKKSREMLDRLPFELKTREPSAEHVRAVVDFAKRTGDFRSLSRTDLRVVALARMFEVERNGTSRLRQGPQPILVNPAKEKSTQEAATDQAESTDDLNSAEQVSLDADETIDAADDNHDAGATSSEPVQQTIDSDELDTDPAAGEWITPDNIEKVQNRSKYGSADAKTAAATAGVHVGCVTADFAMQNVIVQMGLRIVAPDGMLISRTQQWLLRCFACTKLVRDMTKVFCPDCGNHTLKRVAVAVDCDGGVTKVFFSKRPISTRGTRFALPIPRGGRNDPGDLILSESELIRKTQYTHKPKSIDRADFEFGAVNNPRGMYKGLQIGGTGKRNPNSARKNIGKKNASKKRHM